MRATLIGVLLVAWTATIACAQGGRELSKSEFIKSCAPCHGVSGKGDGPIAKSLIKAPADLTKLSQKNGGVFPLSKVYDVIDGRAEITGHGPREMPVWGDAYRREFQNQWGRDLLSDELAQLMARIRILMLVEHISTLQAE
jgi:hypothetical protein